MSSSCLESQVCHLVPLYCLLSCSSAEYCYCFCLIFLLPAYPFCWLFSRKFLNIFVQRGFFFYRSYLETGRIKLIGGMCSMLPCGTGIGCYAFTFFFFCPFLFYTSKKNLRVLTLCAVLTGAIPKGPILQKCCGVFVVCFVWTCVGTDFVLFWEFLVWRPLCRMTGTWTEVCF